MKQKTEGGKQPFFATLKEAKQNCKSYYEENGQLRGCTCGTCPTKPQKIEGGKIDCKCNCHKIVPDEMNNCGCIKFHNIHQPPEKVLSPWPSKCDCKCHKQGKKCCYDCIEIHYPINIKRK